VGKPVSSTNKSYRHDLIGWSLSAIFTETNVIPDDKNSEQYGARTDSRTDVIKTTPWFYFPYPGKMKIQINNTNYLGK
jgi:hypothetical protein